MVTLSPTQFSPNIRAQLEHRLLNEVEGTFTGRHGYVVCVVDVQGVGDGLILPSLGSARYNITYRAIVFKPFKGEALDAVVTSVSQVRRQRRHASCWHSCLMYNFFPQWTLKTPYFFRNYSLKRNRFFFSTYVTECDTLQQGFMAEVGPVNVFVSRFVRSLAYCVTCSEILLQRIPIYHAP